MLKTQNLIYKMQIFLWQIATVIPIKGTRASVNMPVFQTKSLTITIFVVMIFESSHAILWLVLHTCSAKADFNVLLSVCETDVLSDPDILSRNHHMV